LDGTLGGLEVTLGGLGVTLGGLEVTLGGLEVTLGGVGAPGVLVLKGMSPLKRLNLAKPQLGGAGGFALLRNKTA